MVAVYRAQVLKVYSIMVGRMIKFGVQNLRTA
jgi:hypothetical protein